jgi:hypothetical protein
MKNLIIFVLSVLLVGALMALQHMTVRLDAAAAYIDAFEECYPDYLDTVAEGDAYSDYYSLW